jgi:hypothetical protein
MSSMVDIGYWYSKGVNKYPKTMKEAFRYAKRKIMSNK